MSINHSEPKDWGFVEKSIADLDGRLAKVEGASQQRDKTSADFEARLKKLEAAAKADAAK